MKRMNKKGIVPPLIINIGILLGFFAATITLLTFFNVIPSNPVGDVGLSILGLR